MSLLSLLMSSVHPCRIKVLTSFEKNIIHIWSNFVYCAVFLYTSYICIYFMFTGFCIFSDYLKQNKKKPLQKCFRWTDFTHPLKLTKIPADSKTLSKNNKSEKWKELFLYCKDIQTFLSVTKMSKPYILGSTIYILHIAEFNQGGHMCLKITTLVELKSACELISTV